MRRSSTRRGGDTFSRTGGKRTGGSKRNNVGDAKRRQKCKIECAIKMNRQTTVRLRCLMINFIWHPANLVEIKVQVAFDQRS